MVKMRFWSLVFFILALVVGFAYNSFFDTTWEIWPTNIYLAANWLGVYFGIGGVILWLGGESVVANRIMLPALAIGVASYCFSLIVDPLRFSDMPVDGILAVTFWAVGLVSLTSALMGTSPWARLSGKAITAKHRQYATNYFYLIILVCSIGYATTRALQITSIIFPSTIDADLFKIDRAFSGFATYLHHLMDKDWPFTLTLIQSVYSLLSIVILLMLIPVFREKRASQLHIFRVITISFISGFIFYFILPVAGPPGFGESYPDNMQWILDLPPGKILIPPSLRNGMPSMHFTGAMLLVLAAACLRRKVYFYAAGLFAIITFVATMAVGEHYMTDLVVAMPLVIALGTALINPPGWNFLRRRIWWVCVSLFVVWEILLRTETTRFFLIDNLWFVRVLSVLSATAAVWGFASYLATVWYLPDPHTDEMPLVSNAAASEIKQQRSVRWVFGLFICSGFAGLFYEVVFAKHLGVIFGGTALAAYTVMATYMGGMALGAWLGGIMADRVRNPLKWYALFEGAIGLYALATPTLFKLIAHVYVTLAIDVRPDSPVLTLWRVLLGVIVLGIPTILMGTTLPIMFKFLRGYLPGRGSIIAHLYTANIFGAAFGALIGAYAVLPGLGLLSSTRLAALLSLMIALYALDRMKTLPPAPVMATASATETAAINTGHLQMPPQNAWQQQRLGIAGLIVVSVGGIVTLALEIVNMHMLAVIAGNSVYAFGLMLATFLFGLGLGSASYGKARYFLTDPALAAVAQLGIFFSIVVSAFQWDGLSNYFASFSGFSQEYHHFNFVSRELIRGAVCAIIMMPPAFFIGLGYPATMALASDWLKNRGEAAGLGIASLCNTLGNILGVLLTGFVFLNWIGSNRLLLGLAVISLLLGLYMTYVGYSAWYQVFKYNRGLQNKTFTAAAIAIALGLWAYPPAWNLTTLTLGANVYFNVLYRGEVIDARESIQGGLTTVNEMPQDKEKARDAGNNVKPAYTLLTNGKFQGNNTGEINAQRGVALTPLLHEPKRGDVLVIGYGTGNSAHVLHEQGFARMDIAELAQDMVEIADRYFGDINGLVSQKDNVNMYYTDGRNLLLTQNKRYDLISMEISSIWFAGAANLYNREFYQLVKLRLKEDGVLQQWVQLHHMQPMDLLYILNTLHQEFRYVWLYISGGQGVLVASNSEKATHLYHLDGTEAVDTGSLSAEEKALQEDMLLAPADIDYLAQKLRVPQFFVSTDNNLYLEYSTPKGNAVPYDAFAYNIAMLRSLREERLKQQENKEAATADKE